jgi:hypothetical protein
MQGAGKSADHAGSSAQNAENGGGGVDNFVFTQYNCGEFTQYASASDLDLA